MIESHLQRVLDMRRRSLYRGKSFFLRGVDVETLFQMGLVFMLVVNLFFSTAFHQRPNCGPRRCRVSLHCRVPLYDMLRNIIELAFEPPASLVERWRAMIDKP